MVGAARTPTLRGTATRYGDTAASVIVVQHIGLLEVSTDESVVVPKPQRPGYARSGGYSPSRDSPIWSATRDPAPYLRRRYYSVPRGE